MLHLSSRVRIRRLRRLLHAPSGPLALNLWTPDFMSFDPAQPGGALLDDMLTEFETAYPEPLRVETQIKSRYGKGGLLDYLRTAQPVAPGILPDIIALDAAELEAAVAAGAVRPLDGLIDPELLAELYPAARALGRIERTAIRRTVRARYRACCL